MIHSLNNYIHNLIQLKTQLQKPQRKRVSQLIAVITVLQSLFVSLNAASLHQTINDNNTYNESFSPTHQNDLDVDYPTLESAYKAVNQLSHDIFLKQFNKYKDRQFAGYIYTTGPYYIFALFKRGLKEYEDNTSFAYDLKDYVESFNPLMMNMLSVHQRDILTIAGELRERMNQELMRAFSHEGLIQTNPKNGYKSYYPLSNLSSNDGSLTRESSASSALTEPEYMHRTLTENEAHDIVEDLSDEEVHAALAAYAQSYFKYVFFTPGPYYILALFERLIALYQNGNQTLLPQIIQYEQHFNPLEHRIYSEEDQALIRDAGDVKDRIHTMIRELV